MSPLERTLYDFDRATRANGGPVWGVFDCLRFALAGAAREDLLSRLPAYASERGAIRALKRAGFDDLAAALDSVASRTFAPLPGDVCWIAQPPIGALGLIAGREALFLAPCGGLAARTPTLVWALSSCRRPSPPSSISASRC